MIGGQAVIEGVMMRGPRNTAMAVRRADGTIDLERWENTSVKDRCPVLRIPILRGMVSFVEMLVFGYKSLMKSADIASEDEEDGDGEAAPEPSADDAEKAEKEGPAHRPGHQPHLRRPGRRHLAVDGGGRPADEAF